MKSTLLSTPGGRRKALQLTAGLLAVGALGVFASLSHSSAEDLAKGSAEKPKASGPAQNRSAVVAAEPAQRVAVQRELRLDARVASLSSPAVAATVSATVKSVHVSPGERVRKGQLLVVLDATDANLVAQEAQANLSQARALARERSSERVRAEQLFANEFISRSARDAAVLNDTVAQEQLTLAQARQQQAANGVSKAQVLAPMDGVVVDVTVQPGGYARAGDALLNLWNPSEATLTMQVDQTHLGQVKPGQSVQLDWRGQRLTTEVLRVSPVLDAASRSFAVHARVPEELAQAVGAFVGASLSLGQSQQLLVPVTAVQRDARANAFVFRVTDGKAERVAVRTGEQHARGVEILEGLANADVVVTQGAAFLSPGQSVTVATAGPDEKATPVALNGGAK